MGSCNMNFTHRSSGQSLSQDHMPGIRKSGRLDFPLAVSQHERRGHVAHGRQTPVPTAMAYGAGDAVSTLDPLTSTLCCTQQVAVIKIIHACMHLINAKPMIKSSPSQESYGAT